MVTQPRTRIRGRPQAGSDDRRERLLDSGRDLFAASGYAATSLRQVALGADVTPALAHYYFKDKAGLIAAVAGERIAPLMEQIETALAERGTSAAAALAGFVQQFTLASSRHPWLPQLLLRELTDGTGRGAPEEKFAATHFMRPITEKLQALVVAGQAGHSIRSDLRAESIVMSVLSLCAFPFLVGNTLRRELGTSLEAGDAPGMTLHHLAVLQDGLKPRARRS